MEKLVDIKDFVEVVEPSLYIFIALCIVVALVLMFAFYKLFSLFKKRAKSTEVLAKEALQDLDFKDAKKTAYAISKNALVLAKSDMQKEFLDELNQALVKYKYQKNVPSFSDKDKEKFETFMELCDARV